MEKESFTIKMEECMMGNGKIIKCMGKALYIMHLEK